MGLARRKRIRVSDGIWTCLPRGDGLGSGSDATAGSGADGRALASAEDASENRPDGSASAHLFGGILAAAVAGLGV